MKQRSLSNSPMLNLAFEKTARNPSNPRLLGTQVVKVAETELKWNELKKDLEKSPRVAIVSQNASYMKNCDKLLSRRTEGTAAIQNTNYNFYNYNINFSCSHGAGSMILKGEGEDDLGGTFDPRTKPFESARREADRVGIQSRLMARRDEKRVSGGSSGGNSFRLSQGSVNIGYRPSDPTTGTNDKLLQMILEVKANLEGGGSGVTRKRSTTLQDAQQDPRVIHRFANVKKEQPRGRNEGVAGLSKATTEEMASADEDAQVNTTYFKPIRDSTKPMLAKQVAATVEDSPAAGCKSDRQSGLASKSSAEKYPKLKRAGTLRHEEESEEEMGIKAPHESKQPRLINHSCCLGGVSPTPPPLPLLQMKNGSQDSPAGTKSVVKRRPREPAKKGSPTKALKKLINGDGRGIFVGATTAATTTTKQGGTLKRPIKKTSQRSNLRFAKVRSPLV